MKSSSRYSSSLFLLFAIAAMILIALNRQAIYDWYALRNYSPPARIVELADRTTLLPDSRKVFYVYHPELNDKKSFKKNCPTGEHSIVLGCYVSNNGIFLLDVEDPRLSGIIEVTSAHELLHAEYDRLSSGEKENVDSMTASFFAGLQDERIKKAVEQYRAKDSNIVPNELHSILATEVRELSPELEEYYKKYFANRQQIVSYSERYEQTFTNLQNQVANIDKRLNRLKARIEDSQNQIKSENSSIEEDRRRLDALLNSRQTEEYNATVPVFNRRINDYNALIVSTKALIEEYNELVEQRNNIATTEQELIQTIDSNKVPQQQPQ